MNIKQKVDATINQIRSKTDFVPEIALVLGSGLGDLANEVDAVASISYDELEGFPISTVAGHEGKFVFGELSGKKVVIMQGRVHFYEGYEMSDVVLPTRVMAGLGAKTLFLTNSAGGINTGFKPGDLMLIEDQITSFVPSPLIGPNVDEWGDRFPSMNMVYDRELRDKIDQAAKDCVIDMKKGVYIQTTGPAYETPAEIKMFRQFGADAVGMSTTVEATVAIHMGMKVCGISCITNVAGGSETVALSHEEVKLVADKSGENFRRLVKKSIELF